MKSKTVVLMRGIQGTGKSYEARRIAGDEGVVCETDLFLRQLKKEKVPKKDRMNEARKLNFKQFKKQVSRGEKLIVVDRGNGRGKWTKKYVVEAIKNDYNVKFAEPTSEAWKEIKILLKYKGAESIDAILLSWSHKLAAVQTNTHNVKAAKIYKSMMNFDINLTLEDIINYRPKKKKKTAQQKAVKRMKEALKSDKSKEKKKKVKREKVVRVSKEELKKAIEEVGLIGSMSLSTTGDRPTLAQRLISAVESMSSSELGKVVGESWKTYERAVEYLHPHK